MNTEKKSKPKTATTSKFGDWVLQTVAFMDDTQYFISLDNKYYKTHWMSTGRDELGLKVSLVKLAGSIASRLSSIYTKAEIIYQDLFSLYESKRLGIPVNMFKILYRPKQEDKYELIDLYLGELKK